MDAHRFPEAEFPTRDDKNPDAIVLKRYEATDLKPKQVMVETTLGRIVFNECFPEGFPFHNMTFRKADLTDVCSLLVERFNRKEVANSLDNLKDAGFKYATTAGITISIDDVATPAEKAELLNKY